MIDASMAFDHLSRQWVWALAGACWRGGIVLGFACAVSLLPLRWPARLQCWLWRAGYLSLFVALCWTMPIDLPLYRQPAARPAGAPPAMFASVPAEPAPQMAEARSVVHDFPAVSSPTPTTPSAAPAPKLAFHPLLHELLFVAWTAVALIQLARLGRAWMAAGRLRKSATAISQVLIKSIASELAQRLGLKRPPLLLAGQTASGPLLLGLRRPAILLPAALLDSCDPDQIRLLLAHELAHLRRRDLLWNWLPAVGGVFFGFHPLVWIARRQWQAAQEMACDEAAIAITQAPAAHYGRMLLFVASQSQPCAAALAGVGAAESRHNLKRRLSAMKHLPNWSRRRLAFAGLVVTLFAVLSIVPWRVVAQEPPPSSAKPSAAPLAPRLPATGPAAATPLGAPSEYQGRIIANTVNLTAPIDGTIQEIKFDDGQPVEKGQVLVQFDDRRQKALLVEAEVKLQTAASKLQLLQAAGASSVSAAALEDAKAAMQMAKAEVEVRQQDVAVTHVMAPFAGRVGIAKAGVGQTLRQGDSITTLVETGAPKVEFDLPESMLGRVRKGQKVRVGFNSRDEVICQGNVYFIAPEVDSNTGTITLRATIKGDADQLIPGRFCIVSLESSPSASEPSSSRSAAPAEPSRLKGSD